MQPGTVFTRSIVEVFGYRVGYAEAGAGEVIVSLPGSAGLEMSRAKDMLAERFRVIELDPPGWGETPELAGRMRQRHLATLLGAALDELGVDRFRLIGTSMGGTNALWLAAQMPERVTAVFLEAPMAFCRLEDLVRPESEGMIDAVRNGLSYDNSYPAPPPHPNKPWATAAFFHEQMRRRFKMFRHSDHPGEPDRLAPLVAGLAMPVTLLIGTEDEILKPSYAAQLQSKIPALHVTIVENATHDIQNTAPEPFVHAVLAA